MATQEVTFKINANAAAAQAEFRKLAVAATQSQKQIATANKQGASSASEFSNALKQASAAVGVLQGPLNGISGRISALGTLFRAASTDVAAVGTEAATTGASVAAMAGPIGIAIAAVAGLTVGAGLLAKGLFDLAQSAAAWRGALFDTSQQVGISTETLSALEILAKTTGSSLDQITASLGIFQKHLEAAQEPTSKEAKLLKELGVNAGNTEDALKDTLKALAAMPEGFHQTATALELFGRGGKSMLAILKEMHGDLDGAMAKFREMGLIVSQEDAKAADEFNDQLETLNFQFRALVGKEAMPAVLDAMKQLSTLLKDNHAAVEALGAVVGAAAYIFGASFKKALFDVTNELALMKIVLQPVIDLYERLTATVTATANATILAAQATAQAVASMANLAGSGDFGGGEAGGAATAIHQPARAKVGGGGGGRKAGKSDEDREAERALKARIDLTSDLTAELNKQLAIESGLDVTTREYAVSQDLLNGALATASADFKEMVIGQAKFVDDMVKRNKLTAELRDFQKDQAEAVRLVLEGEKGHIRIAEELIDSLRQQGVFLSETEKHWLMMRAAILANNDALKMYIESTERLAAVEVAGAATKGIGDEEIARLSGAAADEAAGALPEVDAFNAKQQAITAGIETMQEAFDGLGQAVAQVVQSFVLYGSAGTSVRKVTAQILAGVAQQAAVKAVFELAEGFAALALAFFGMPNAGPSATAHFTAAAMYGAIAGVAAIAGRAVAGNAFQKATEGPGGTGGGKGGKDAAGKPETTEQNRRNYEPVIHIVMKDGVHDLIEASVVKNWNNNGRIRNVVQKDGG